MPDEIENQNNEAGIEQNIKKGRRKYSTEEMEKLMQLDYKPYSLHIFDHVYVADINGKLIVPPKSSNGQSYEFKREISNFQVGDDKKQDIIETKCGKFYIREWRKGSNGKFRESKITNKEIPSAKIEVSKDSAKQLINALQTLEENQVGG